MRIAFLFASTAALYAATLDSSLFSRLEYRSIGPTSMGGRICDVAGIPGDISTVYVASCSGGLWKTVNGGVNWKPIFENQSVLSIGAIAIDPKNPEVIWVGTGEANARNSVSFGNGVYKSLDGGKTWRHMGLPDSRSISRVAINPLNTNIVYVAALGHNSGPNEERGVFMTTDGGETWTKSFYLDAEHGASDLDINPLNPNIVYAAMWRFERRPWKFVSGSDKTGIYRSTDAGKTWNRLTEGLTRNWGRVGVRVAPGNPNVVYVVAESNDGTLYRSDDGGDHFRMITKDPKVVGRGLYYSHVTVDPTDENRVFAIAMSLFSTIDGGHTWKRIAARTHGDYHAVWVDPKNPSRIWIGEDGGIAVSYDRAETFEFVNNIPLGQFYQITADNRQPFYHLFGGLQDNGTHTGPSRNRKTGIAFDDWSMVSWGDGFHAINHPDDPDLYLSENQGGGIVRTNMRTGDQQDVSPQPRRNDGGPVNELKYRFNWNAPIVASPHDKNTVYFGSNVVFKSTDFGKNWTSISGDLTTNDPAKIGSVGTVWVENTTAEYHCTVIRIAESPVKAGNLWAGTDDGNLQVTTDGGVHWTNVVANVPGVPKFAEISSIAPSRTAAGTVYAAFEHHWFDDLHPYIYKTTDNGATWTNISGNLPSNAYVWVVREDPRSPNLLYAGTELGLFVSNTGGTNWFKLHLKNMPPVAVRDLQVHPRDNDLILGTHGRSIWIFDDASVIQQMSEATLSQPAVLFDPRPGLRFTQYRQSGYGLGDKKFLGPNPPYGSPVTYYLRDKIPSIKLEVLDGAGKVIRTIAKAPAEAGVNRIYWDLRYDGPRTRKDSAADDDENEFRGPPRGPQAIPGRYTVRLTAGSTTVQKPIEVKADPTWTAVTATDLKAEFEYGLKLRDLQSSTNDALKALDNIRDQIDTSTRTVGALSPEATKDLINTLKERLQQIASIEDKLARPGDIPGYSMGPRLIDRLSQLAGGLENTLTGPTEPQRELYKELLGEFNHEIDRVNKLMTDGIPQINEMLRKQNAGAISAGKPIAAPPNAER
jgi:photosystem II stability/assembly factor-like uncharacterized protein